MPAPHDLLQLSNDEVATLSLAAPGWVKFALARAPYAVVRRGRAGPAMVAVGVRGTARGERFGSSVALRDGRVRITPESLARTSAWRAVPYRDQVPALGALDAVAVRLGRSGLRWGPCGSVGFELATGQPTATATSDLDIVVYSPGRMAKCQAGEMVRALEGLGCRVDVILETPAGGVSLREFADSPGEILARTPNGSLLIADPWEISAPALVWS